MRQRLLAVVTAILFVCLPTQLFAQSRLFGAPPITFQPHGSLTQFPGAMVLHLPLFGAPISSNGTNQNTWQLSSPTGPLWNNNAGALEAKDPTNSTLIVVRGAPPVGSTDFTQKGYSDTHVGGSTLPAPPGSGTTVLTDTTGTLSWSAVAASFTPGTDLSGTSTSQTVVGWQGRTLSASAPAAGNGYYWSGSAWVPSALNLAGGTAFITGILPAANQASQTVGGDLSGTTAAAAVVGLRGNALPNPSGTNSFLSWTGSALTWATPASGFTAGTDLAGTSSSQTVVGFQGRGLTGATPATGNAYYWTGTTWAPSALNLAGGAGFLTGILPAANQASQTLAGDVGGTTAANVLATVNSGPGTYGGPATIPILTVNGKGLTTLLTTATVAAPLASATGTLATSQIAPGTNGQVLTTVGGAAAWSSQFVSSSTLIYQPSGTTAGNTYTSFSALTTAAGAIAPAPVQVFFDCHLVSNNCSIPSGTYSFTNQRVDWIGTPQIASSANVPTVTFANGAVLTTPPDAMRDLTIITNSASPVVSWTGAERITQLSNVEISSTTSTPFANVSGTGYYGFQATGSSAVGAIFGDGVHPVITTTGASATAGVAASGWGNITANSIAGTGTSITTLSPNVVIGTTGIPIFNYSAVTDFVFEPGGSPNTGNAFALWPALYQAVLGTATPVEIDFDCSHTAGTCTVPSGAWAFANSRVTFRGAMLASSGPSTTVSFASGATLSGNIEFQSADYTTAGSAPVLTVNASSTTNRYEFSDFAFLDATGSAPFVSVTGTVTTQWNFADSTIGALSSGHAVITSAGASSVAQVSLGGKTSTAASGSITGAGASVFINSTASTNASSAPTTLNTVAASLGYNDTLVAPTLGSSNAQGAIDALKSKSGIGIGLVYQPGGTAVGNVFTNFSTLTTAANTLTGAIDVAFDCHITSPCPIPAGTYAFTNLSTTFTGNSSGLSTSSVTHVVLADGVHLSGVSTFNSIHMDTTATSTAPMLAPNVTWLGSNVSFTSQTSTPLIQVPINDYLALVLDSAFNTIGDGTHVAIDASLSGAGAQIINAPGGTQLLPNCVSSNVTLSISGNTINNSGVAPALALNPIDLLFVPIYGTLSPPIQNVGIVFSSWPLLVAAAADLRYTPVRITFAANATIPAGAWSFTNPSVILSGPGDNLLGGTLVTLTVANGATLSGVTGYHDLYIVYSGSGPVVTASGTQQLISLNGLSFQVTGSSPFFSAPSGANLGLQMTNVQFGDGVHAVASNAGTGIFYAYALGATSIANNAFAGTLGQVNVVEFTTGFFRNGGSAIEQAGLNVSLQTQSAIEGYNDTLASPTLGSGNVQGAIDALKGRVINTLPSPGSNGQVLTVAGGVWTSAAAPSGFTAGTDLSGTSTSQTVVGVQGHTLPSLTAGCLDWTGSAWSYASCGGSGGITQLTQDVTAGPGSGSQVAQVNSASGTAPFTFKPTLFQWLAGTTNPEITQAAAAANTNGQVLFVQAQNGGSGATTGGTALILGGTGGSVTGSAALETGDQHYGVAATGTGISFGGTVGSRVSWIAGISGPTLTQDTAVTGSGSAMLIQSQQGASGGLGGALELLSGAGGLGGTEGPLLLATPDGQNEINLNANSVDIVSGHNIRIGSWGGTYTTGQGVVQIANETSAPTGLIAGGADLEVNSQAFELNGLGIAFTPFATSAYLTQEPAPASTNGGELVVSAQKGGAGNANGGPLVLLSGQNTGTGIAGELAIETGDGSNEMILFPGPTGGFAAFAFAANVQQPLFQQEQAGSGLNGQTLTMRAQGGGAGTTNGGNLILTGGIQGTSGTGGDGAVIMQSVDQSNSIVVGDDGWSNNAATATGIVGVNATSSSVAALSYVPSMSYSSSQRVLQIVRETKHIDVCHIISPGASSSTCGVNIPMNVRGQVHVHILTQCRVTTGGSGTADDDMITSDGYGDWVNTGGGATIPQSVGSGGLLYGGNPSGTPGVFSAIVYSFGGNTAGGAGYMVMPFSVHAVTGNIGTMDCTTWTDEFFN